MIRNYKFIEIQIKMKNEKNQYSNEYKFKKSDYESNNFKLNDNKIFV